ncbi:MAG: potassium-transporting ATPase subunit KdpC [Bacteroidota bacterium]
MRKHIITSIKYLLLMIILTGGIYPAIVTVTANLLFRNKAQGSLIMKDSVIIGSALIGQNFDGEEYFWPRPSVNYYNPLPSGASNLSHINPVLIKTITERKLAFTKLNMPGESEEIPSVMITSSASGLDPHISPEAALLQAGRVAKARGLSPVAKEQVLAIIHEMTEKPQFSFLGEPRINVFLLNLKLDSI